MDLKNIYWNLDDLARTRDLEKDIEEVKSKAEVLKISKSLLIQTISPEKFAEIMQNVEEVFVRLTNLVTFAHLSFYKNTGDAKAQALVARMDQLDADIKNRMLFIEINFKEFNDKNAKRLIDALPNYRHYLNRLREMKPFTLSEEVEKVVNLKDVTGYSALTSLYDTFTAEFMFEFERKRLAKEELMKYVVDPSPKKRERAYKILFEVFSKNKNTLAFIYQTIVHHWRNEQELRKYASPISIRNKQNNIGDEDIDLLLEIFNKNMHIFHEYFKEKARLIGMNKLKRYDIYAPIQKSVKVFTFPQARELVNSAFHPFPEFVQFANAILEDHLDSEPNPGKRGGAFCYYPNQRVKPFVMMNFVGNLNSVKTLAHELGHSIHAMLSSRENNFYHYDPVLPMAETASTFGELLLFDDLKKRHPELRQELIIGQLDNAYATIARQFQFVLFEKDAHALIKEGKARDDLESHYLKQLSEHFKDSVDVDDLFRYEYLTIPHIYHTPFYCYAYGFGLLLAMSLYAKWLKEPAFNKEIIKILSAGSNDSPRNILKKSDIELNRKFWQSGFDYLNNLVKEVKKFR